MLAAIVRVACFLPQGALTYLSVRIPLALLGSPVFILLLITCCPTAILVKSQSLSPVGRLDAAADTRRIHVVVRAVVYHVALGLGNLISAEEVRSVGDGLIRHHAYFGGDGGVHDSRLHVHFGELALLVLAEVLVGELDPVLEPELELESLHVVDLLAPEVEEGTLALQGPALLHGHERVVDFLLLSKQLVPSILLAPLVPEALSVAIPVVIDRRVSGLRPILIITITLLTLLFHRAFRGSNYILTKRSSFFSHLDKKWYLKTLLFLENLQVTMTQVANN